MEGRKEGREGGKDLDGDHAGAVAEHGDELAEEGVLHGGVVADVVHEDDRGFHEEMVPVAVEGVASDELNVAVGPALGRQ